MQYLIFAILMAVIVILLHICFKQRSVICERNNVIGALREHNDILERQVKQLSEEKNSL